jgi:hypothetical protein
VANQTWDWKHNFVENFDPTRLISTSWSWGSGWRFKWYEICRMGCCPFDYFRTVTFHHVRTSEDFVYSTLLQRYYRRYVWEDCQLWWKKKE